MFEELLNKEFMCECEQHYHKAGIKKIEIKSGANQSIPKWIKNQGYNNVLVVSDVNTYKAAAKNLIQCLKNENIKFFSFIYDDEMLAADDINIQKLMSVYNLEMDLIVAVGSGTINDLCKFTSHRLDKPYICVGTAPSMDGYASESASITIDGIKQTIQASCPIAIFCDTDILCEAPMELMAAGLGDMLGKYSCLCDWQTSHMLFGEYYCKKIAGMMRNAVNKCVSAAEGCFRREKEAIENLTAGLILSGLAMTFAGSSRPAGGCEHHLSHFWEMRFMQWQKKPVLHGAKVGVATVIILKFYEELLQNIPDFENALSNSINFNVTEWETDMRKFFGDGANILICSPEIRKQFDATEHKKRLEAIKASWVQITDLWREIVPSSETIEGLLKILNAPTKTSELDVSEDLVRDSIMFAKYGRNKYTLLQLLWDIGYCY